MTQVNLLLLPTLAGTGLLFWWGFILQRKLQTRGRAVLSAVAVMLACPAFLYFLYYTHLIDDAGWFYNLRTAPYTELLVCGVGVAAGALQAWWEPQSFGEKAIAPTLAFALVMVPFVKPLLDPLDLSKLKNRCEGDVCLQSTFSTCGPASMATLLRAFGYDASERQLACESFTSRGGTEIWYLARAARRRGIGTTVVIKSPEADMTLPSPAIAGVVLPGNAGHFIAILASDGRQVTFVDPMKGRSTLSLDELRVRYHFTGFFLVLSQPLIP